MVKYIVKRIITVFIVLWMVATLTYFTIHVTPGDTATAILYSIGGESAVSSENLEHVRNKYDLNRPVLEQYVEWVTNAFRGELGTSYKYNKPVAYMLRLRVPNTIRLGFAAVALSVVIAIPFGIASALAPQSSAGPCGAHIYPAYIFLSLFLGGHCADYRLRPETEIAPGGRYGWTAEYYSSGGHSGHGYDGGDDSYDAQQYVGCDGSGLHMGIAGKGSSLE